MTDEEAVLTLLGKSKDNFQMAIALGIDALRERIGGGWTSVWDGHPEEKTDVQVFGKKYWTEGGKEMEDAFPSIYVAYTRGDRECYFGSEGGNLIVVTHWRPLPLPPKEANG